MNVFSRGYSLGVWSVFADSSTDVDIFFLHWVKTPSIGFQSSFVTSLLSKRGFSFFFFLLLFFFPFLPKELTQFSEESSGSQAHYYLGPFFIAPAGRPGPRGHCGRAAGSCGTAGSALRPAQRLCVPASCCWLRLSGGGKGQEHAAAPYLRFCLQPLLRTYVNNSLESNRQTRRGGSTGKGWRCAGRVVPEVTGPPHTCQSLDQSCGGLRKPQACHIP